MKVYVNSRNEIKDVNTTTDTSLTELTITDGTFDNWSVAKICCYKVRVIDGNVTMMTPYVDSRLIEHIDNLSKSISAITPYMDSKRGYVGDTECTFTSVAGSHVTAYCETDSGVSIKTTVKKVNDTVIVSFEKLEEVSTITISVI